MLQPFLQLFEHAWWKFGEKGTRTRGKVPSNMETCAPKFHAMPSAGACPSQNELAFLAKITSLAIILLVLRSMVEVKGFGVASMHDHEGVNTTVGQQHRVLFADFRQYGK